MLSVGIIGLPNVGKSTLFNALMQREIAKVGRHPFTTVTPNKGIVVVPDKRLEALVKMVNKNLGLSQEATPGVEKRPAAIEFVDIAGLVKGAAEGAGLGNRFLSHIREVNLILHVLREFDNFQVAHVAGRVDPVGDASTVDLELILADFEVVSRAVNEREKKARSDKKLTPELEILKKVKQALDSGLPAISAGLKDEEAEIISSFNLLTLKPAIFILNISEKHLNEGDFPKKSLPEGIIIPVCIKLAADLYEIQEVERKEFMKDLGIKKTGLEQIIKTAYKTLNLISFFTVKGSKKISAWPLKEGSTALDAAGTIHTDFEKRFIKAEVLNWQKLIKAGSWQRAREKGWLQLQGKDYKILDGDVVEFKFN